MSNHQTSVLSSTLSQSQSDITQLGAAEIARQIASGKLSACDVIEAFIARIEEVNPQINALVVPMFDSARQTATEADQWQSRGEPLGPLHGVPVTIKECFHLAGTPSTIGLPDRVKEILQHDGPLTQRLKQAGAIPLGKTNVPQLMICNECENPLYGLTKNPWNLARGPGGSSGGEAAIIAAGGSPLGLGSDLGGSIRVPAHACGITGLLPTARRLTRRGSTSLFGGMETLIFQPGPMARRVEDLALAMRVLGDQSKTPRDDGTPPVSLPDPTQVNIAGLRIAYWTDDGYFPAAPSVRRVVEEAAEALRERGAIVEKYQPPNVEDAMRLYYGILGAEGGDGLRQLAKGSRLDWRNRRLLRIARLPKLARNALVGLLRMAGQKRSADLLSHVRRRSVNQYRQLSQQITDYRERFFRVFEAGRYDAMLFPPYALPALKHQQATDLIEAASYSYLPNLLGIPAGVVPFGRVRVGEESDRLASRDRIDKIARSAEADSVGLPLGVQLAARHWREDIVLAGMTVLEEAFENRPDGPLRCPI